VTTLHWTIEQLSREVGQFDQAMTITYPESKASVQNAAEYLKTIGGTCNYIAAAEQVDWSRYLQSGSKLLDIGSGGGWLTAMLSRLDAVQTVYALDSSQHFLHKLMPQVMELMQGRLDKLVPVEGLFQPLLFADAHLDVVVASSALHHADSLESVLKEIRRTLKSGGLLFVLNETPRPGFRHLVSVVAAAVRIVRNLALKRYQSVSPSISSSCYLYDPKLGDRDYPIWYWEKALQESGFSIESVMNTGMPTVKGSKGRPLIHFICRAA
jgi:ubiquinone/menaquinone biosynthesis C-methylase UbiE